MRLAILLFPLLAIAQIQQGFIYESAPFPECHASTIVETAPGEFYAAWFGGTKEGAKDVAIWGARLKDGAWSAPVELAREKDQSTYNPVLFFTKDKKLWLFYKHGLHPKTWNGAKISSLDGGRTWSEKEYLPAGLYGPIKNKPLVLADGTVVSGTSVESDHAWTAWVERSTDNAQTWTKHGPIVYPAEARGIIQPTIVPIGKNTLRMYIRSTKKIGFITYADSKDGGKTWSSAKITNLPNPDSGIDAVALKDGRIVLIYNHTSSGRSPLNIAVSKDGDKWTAPIVLESEPGEYSYPAIIQAADGKVHATWTWHRKKVKHAVIPLESLPN
ncbi:sialidase family protein [Bryobacter aggregatus]|uniref:sialidase family protein n=1 Tax=Bryobacter aggregatus TaxID=360054 RepID=UPI0004E28460|nr:sialidase family protein [Bryobacter aggregatus]